MDSDGGDDGGDNRGDDGGRTRRLMPSGTISAVSLNPLAVLVNREGSLLLKA